MDEEKKIKIRWRETELSIDKAVDFANYMGQEAKDKGLNMLEFVVAITITDDALEKSISNYQELKELIRKELKS